MLESAALALVAIAIEIESVRATGPYPVAAEGEDRESLLVNWLNEVLYYVDGRRVAFRRFAMNDCRGLRAAGIGWGEPRTQAHPARLIVKGVTYHQLAIVQNDGGWQCQVFLDI
jgi:SHS2 domain-containing protein